MGITRAPQAQDGFPRSEIPQEFTFGYEMSRTPRESGKKGRAYRGGGGSQIRALIAASLMLVLLWAPSASAVTGVMSLAGQSNLHGSIDASLPAGGLYAADLTKFGGLEGNASSVIVTTYWVRVLAVGNTEVHVENNTQVATYEAAQFAVGGVDGAWIGLYPGSAHELDLKDIDVDAVIIPDVVDFGNSAPPEPSVDTQRLGFGPAVDAQDLELAGLRQAHVRGSFAFKLYGAELRIASSSGDAVHASGVKAENGTRTRTVLTVELVEGSATIAAPLGGDDDSTAVPRHG